MSKTIARLVKEVSTLGNTVSTPISSGVTESKVNALIDAKVGTLVSQQVTEAIAGLTAKIEQQSEEIDALKKPLLAA